MQVRTAAIFGSMQGPAKLFACGLHVVKLMDTACQSSSRDFHRNIHVLYQRCTSTVPALYQCCTSAVPVLVLYQRCTSTVPVLCQDSTSTLPVLY